MTTLVETGPAQRFVLSGVDWATYVAFGDLLGERHVRLTYDRGAMELMTLSYEHESLKHFVGRLIEALSDESSIFIAGGGSTTFRREGIERGLEPDECYWVANEPRIRGKRTIDLAIDPPPDLVVEVSRSALPRLGILAAMGVPEVWRCDDDTVTMLVLGTDGDYAPSERSRSFPLMAASDLHRFLSRRTEMAETALVREFRLWVRRQVDSH